MAKNTVQYILKINKEGTGAKEAKEELSGVENVAKKAGAALAGFLTVETVKATLELGRMGAESLRTKSAFENISGGADNAAANLKAMQAATRGAISETAAMQAANQLMQMGLANTSDELFDVSEMAVRLGTAMGRDAKDSLSEFSLLLANQSIPRLDTFGISASGVRKRIKELQQATADLTREEAFAIAVREEGTLAMQRLGAAADDDLLAFERLEATTENLKTMVGEALAPVLADAVGALELLLTWSDRVHDALGEQEDRVAATAGSYEEYIAALQESAGVAGLSVDAQGNLIEIMQQTNSAAIGLATETARVVTANFAMTESAWNAAAAGDAITTSFGGLQTEAIAVATGIEGAAVAAEKAVGFFGGLVNTTQELGGQFKNANVSGETTYDLLLKTESGAKLSAEQVGVLSTQLGLTTGSQIRAKDTQLRLIEAWDKGLISSGDLVEGTELLEEASDLAKESLEEETDVVIFAGDEAAIMSEKMFDAAENILNTAGAADDLTVAIRLIPDTKEFTLTAHGLDEAGRDAESVYNAILRIPDVTHKYVYTHFIELYDDGEPPFFPPQITADVSRHLPRRGGEEELPFFPPQITADGVTTTTGIATRGGNGGGNTYIRQGDTLIINDSLAAQLALEMSQTDILRTFE